MPASSCPRWSGGSAVAAVHTGGPTERGTMDERPTAHRERPEAHGWFWSAACQCDDAVFADLVEALAPGLQLSPGAVLALTDAMAGPSPTARVRAHAAVLRTLQPQHPLNQDLATLVACSPLADPPVLAAALELLAAVGHPTRTVLTRAAARAVREDRSRVAYASTVAASLAPPLDAEEESLAAWCAAQAPRAVPGPLPERPRRARKRLRWLC
jgi:hypothetical protein